MGRELVRSSTHRVARGLTIAAIFAFLALPAAAQDAEPAPKAPPAPAPARNEGQQKLKLRPTRVPFVGTRLGIERAKEGDGKHRTDRLVSLEISFGKAKDPELIALCAQGGVIPRKRVGNVQEKVEVVSAPRLMVFDGQQANVSVLSQKRFVQSYDAAGKPVLGTIRAGTVVDVTPRITADGKTIRLSLRFRSAHLQQPMRKATTETGDIDMPQVTMTDIVLMVPVKNGQTFYVGLPRAIDNSAALLAVHATDVQATAVLREAINPDKPRKPHRAGPDRGKSK